MTVIEGRLPEIESIELKSGGHRNLDDGACVMEAVAYVAGEPWSDHPQCACPVLTSFMVSWNDTLNDTDRQRLKPYIPRLVGTRSTPEAESVRAWMACDWLVRTFTPKWLRLVGLDEEAAALEGLPELTSTELVEAALPVIRKAKKGAAAAGAAAWAAARDAAGAAAGAAARAAAWAAARDAAGAAARDAAGAAAGAAARDAAWAAARDAAGAAAGAALAPIVSELQDSAFDLLDRMIAVAPATQEEQEAP